MFALLEISKKRTYLKIIVFATILISVVGAFTCIEAQGGEIEQEIENAVMSFHSDLSSMSDRMRYSAILRLFIDRRIEANVSGYEKNPEFSQRYISLYQDDFLINIFTKKIPTVHLRKLKDFIRKTGDAYKANESQFMKFYQETIRCDKSFHNISAEEIRKAVLYFSLYIYHTDRDMWETSWKVSGLWPFCRKPGLTPE